MLRTNCSGLSAKLGSLGHERAQHVSGRRSGDPDQPLRRPHAQEDRRILAALGAITQRDQPAGIGHQQETGIGLPRGRAGAGPAGPTELASGTALVAS